MVTVKQFQDLRNDRNFAHNESREMGRGGGFTLKLNLLQKSLLQSFKTLVLIYSSIFFFAGKPIFFLFGASLITEIEKIVNNVPIRQT